jgi:uncharacterized low-complexity protein
MKTRRDFFKLTGAAMVSVTGIASASENPFGLTKMDSGYTQVAMEGKCGEGKCGGKMKEEAMKEEAMERKEMKNSKEGSCGGMNKQPMEGKCGGQKS